MSGLAIAWKRKKSICATLISKLSRMPKIKSRNDEVFNIPFEENIPS